MTNEQKENIQKMFERQEYETVLGVLPETPAKNSTMCIFGDGSYLLRENTIGRFVRKISEGKFPAIDSGPTPSFTLRLPKIPFSFLREQVCFYREVMKRHSDAEAYTIILWDTEKKEYILVCPKQKISKASVQYVLDDEYLSARYIQVVSCHSHNSMNSFFSGTDDADEKGDMLYMVMGKLNKTVPEFKIRACLAGKQVCLLDIDSVFTIDQQEWEMLSPGWQNQFNEEWFGRLNVAAPYVGIHTVQGGSAREGFRFGTYEPAKNSQSSYSGRNFTSKRSGRQLTLEDFFYQEEPSDDTRGNSSETDSIEALVTAARALIRGVLMGGAAEDCLTVFIERACEAGFEDVIYDDGNVFDPPWWTDELGDEPSSDFDKVNEYLSRTEKA